MLERYCQLYSLSLREVRCIHSPEELTRCSEYFEIIYICFGGAAGFTSAQQLRSKSRSSRIILVDDTKEYAIRGVRLHCTDFILRPVSFPHIVQSMRLATGGARI